MVLRNKDVVRLTALDVRPADNLAILLFRRSDPDATPPIFESLKTRKLRPSDKGEDDAIAVSAHLFVSLKEGTGPEPVYPAILEEVPGLGRTYIQGILGDILRDAKYGYKDPRGEVKSTHTLIDFQGVKAESIEKALSGATIPYVELVRPPKIKGLDTEGIVAREERMRLVVRAEPEKALAIINRVKKWAGNDWSEVKVRINMPEHRSRLVSIAREQDAKDVLFVRALPIKVETPLLAATEVISEELVSKAQEIFSKKG